MKSYVTSFTIIFILFSSILSNDERSSKEIQKSIDSSKNELDILRNEVKNIEKKLLLKNKEAIGNTEILITLENKIALTEKLIRSLNREEKYINKLIQDTENKIKNKETLLEDLKRQLTLRLQYLYVYGKSNILSTIFLSANWNNIIYKIKYLETLSEYEKKLRIQINTIIRNLDAEKKQLQSDYDIKKQLLNEKKDENKNLEDNKKERKTLLEEIKKERSLLEKNRLKTNKNIEQMESIIKKLFADKKAVKKREEELARIRAQQNQSTTGNFAKMKGKLIWPVNGKIISSFGTTRNPETGVITENVGIDIQAPAGSKVISVLDGVVSTITYIRSYGNIVIIDHGGGFSTVYSRIDNIVINENDYIQMGKTIALISLPEDQSKSRLHFEVWGNQEKLNPKLWLLNK